MMVQNAEAQDAPIGESFQRQNSDNPRILLAHLIVGQEVLGSWQSVLKYQCFSGSFG